LFRSGAASRNLQQLGIREALQLQQPLETRVKHWVRSNDRIKSYCPFQVLFQSGSTRPPLHRVGILFVLQGKQHPKTTVKVWARSNGLIKSYSPF
jgi:hypothetical protein